MEVSGSVDRRDVDQGEPFVPRLEQPRKAHRLVDLARVGGVERALAQAQSAIDQPADQQGPVVGRHVNRDVGGEGLDLLLELVVELLVPTSAAVRTTSSISVGESEKSAS